jgi:hypothetical protein
MTHSQPLQELYHKRNLLLGSTLCAIGVKNMKGETIHGSSENNEFREGCC